MAATGIGFELGSNLCYGLLEEVVCSFQSWNLSTFFNWLAKWLCYYSCENRWISFWWKIRLLIGLVSYIVSLAKTGCKKVGAFIPSMKFLSFKVGLYLSKYVIQSCLKYCLLCLYGLVLLVAILISRISYRSKYVGLLVICMLLLWNPWLIIEIYSAQVFSIG